MSKKDAGVVIDAGVPAESTAAPQPQAQVQQPTPPQAQPQPQPAPLLFFILPVTMFFLVKFFLALPWAPVLRTMKPWSCEVCLASWAAILMYLPLYAIGGGAWAWALLHLMPSAGLTVFLLSFFGWLEAKRGADAPPVELPPAPAAPAPAPIERQTL